MNARPAICPKCDRRHPEAGKGGPWSLTPRCVACGSVLFFPGVAARSARRDRDRRIREMWSGGATLPQMAVELGTSVFTISRAARRMGMPSRSWRSGRQPERRTA